MAYLEVYECDFCHTRVERIVSWSYPSKRDGIPEGWDTVHHNWICKECSERLLKVEFPRARAEEGSEDE